LQQQNLKVVQVCCSDYLTLALTDTGEVWHIGGACLKDKSNVPADLNEAFQTEGFGNAIIEQISCGDYHCAAVAADGSLYTWGGGKTAQYAKG
jgi:E3 ubiquitin-protein ligase HERC3